MTALAFWISLGLRAPLILYNEKRAPHNISVHLIHLSSEKQNKKTFMVQWKL